MPKEEKETQSLDIEAATAEISSELFGQGDDDDPSLETEEAPEKASGEESTDALSSEPQKKEDEKPVVEEKPLEENSEAVQAVGAPATWNKEELATWATIPKEIQDKLTPILARREEDFFKGITQYKEAADLGVRYSKVAEPYLPMLAAENVDPVQLFNSFAANHYLLLRGSPEQKIQLAANLINGYGIDFAQLIDFVGEQGHEPIDPQIAALQKEIAELRSGLSADLSSRNEETRVRVAADVDAFAADPAHPHFEEVSEHMAKLLESGLAKDLKDAYEQAVYANPATRQKEFDRLNKEKADATAAEEKARKDKIKRSTADHVKTSPHQRDGTVPVGTMDDTLEETMRSINERTE